MGSGFIFWRLGFPLPLFDLGRLLLSASLCGLAARSCVAFIPGSVSLVLAVAAGAVTYALSVRVLHALHPADAERLRVLCHRLPASFGVVGDLTAGLLAPARTSRAGFVGAGQRSGNDGN
jgi:hypothetical protein